MVAWGTLFPLEVGNWSSARRFNTDITVGKSGHESRNANWQDPLRVFNASFNIKTYADIQLLDEIFLLVKGREQSFLIKDWSDFQIERQTIGTGNGSATTFQLKKTYTNAVIGTYDRIITKPKAIEGVGGVRVWVNDVELETSAFSFSSVTGIITLSAAPTGGHVVEASCDEFFVPVRFDTDELPIDMLNYWIAAGEGKSNVQIPPVPLIEVRGE